MARFLVKNNQIITILFYIGLLVSFVAYPNVTYPHRREKYKGCQII